MTTSSGQPHQPRADPHERHRVWHVRATLKDDKSHVYSRRDFYIDEDSWQIAVVDHYDGRGDLWWRVAEAHMLQLPEPKVPAYAFEALYDLRSGRYVINGLTNEERNPYQFDKNTVTGNSRPLRYGGVIVSPKRWILEPNHT